MNDDTILRDDLVRGLYEKARECRTYREKLIQEAETALERAKLRLLNATCREEYTDRSGRTPTEQDWATRTVKRATNMAYYFVEWPSGSVLFTKRISTTSAEERAARDACEAAEKAVDAVKRDTRGIRDEADYYDRLAGDVRFGRFPKHYLPE